MSSTNTTINLLLEEALNEPDIGTTNRFRWHATAVGIAALWTDDTAPTTPPFDDALQEGLKVGLDLSREEREFHQVQQGLVLLFHSDQNGEGGSEFSSAMHLANDYERFFLKSLVSTPIHTDHQAYRGPL